MRVFNVDSFTKEFKKFAGIAIQQTFKSKEWKKFFQVIHFNMIDMNQRDLQIE